MTHDEIIAVVAAHRDGKSVQFRWHGNNKWIDADLPGWDFAEYYYRIKPEPTEPTP